MTKKKKKKYWLDKPCNINKIIYVLYATCVGLLLLDFIYHRHAYFQFEHWFGFYAWFGFLAYTGIVMSAKLLRKIIKRQENYYD